MSSECCSMIRASLWTFQLGRPARHLRRHLHHGLPRSRPLHFEPLEQRQLLSAGDLDPSFHLDGKVTTDFGSPYGTAAVDVAIQSDGKIVAAGTRWTADGAADFALARYDSSGELDADFGAVFSGRVSTDFGGDDEASAVAVQGGRIVVVGSTNADEWPGGAIAIACYDELGNLDSTFNEDGMLVMNFGYDSAGATGVAIDDFGRIVVVGSVLLPLPPGAPPHTFPPSDFAVARFLADGTPDPDFHMPDGPAGLVTVDFGWNDYAAEVALQSDGKIVVVGSTYAARVIPPQYSGALSRLDENGQLDPAFGANGDGRVVTSGPRYPSLAFDHVAMDPSDNIVVAGHLTYGAGTGDPGRLVAVARYTPGGVLDPGFGASGMVTSDFGADGGIVDVAVQRDGRIVVAGSVYDPITEAFDFALMRYNIDGSLDDGGPTDLTPSDWFGAGGHVATDFASTSDTAYAVAIQADGKIVAAGEAASGTGSDFALARYEGGTTMIEDLPHIVDVLRWKPGPVKILVALGGQGTGTAGDDLAAATAAVNSLEANPDGPAIEIVLDMEEGEYDGGETLAPPEGIQLILAGHEGAVISSTGEPALSVVTGEVMLAGQLTLAGTGDTAVCAVSGGSLVLVGTTDLVKTIDAGAAGEVQVGMLIVEGGVQFIESSTNLWCESSGAEQLGIEVVGIRMEGGSLQGRGFTAAVKAGKHVYVEKPCCVEVRGCTVDLGTADDPGGNTFELDGDGQFITNLGSDPISAVGNTFILNGQDITDQSYLIEDHIHHALDEAGCGLVTYVPDNVFVTQDSGSVQRAVDAVPPGYTVNVQALACLTPYAADGRLLTVAYQGGPTLTLEADPQKPASTRLVATGTPETDTILFERGCQCGEVAVKYNGYLLGTHRPTSRLVALGEAGDDLIGVSCLIGLPAWLYGGQGNDALVGGSGKDVLVGGDGNDVLTSGLGRSLIIGGNGADLLVGSLGEDILIAGRTTMDDWNAANDAALWGVMSEWTGCASYDARVGNLRNVLRTGADGQAATVFDDNARDIVFGLLGRDWFFANLAGGGVKDLIADRNPLEFVSEL